jgi:hypothetical protein
MGVSPSEENKTESLKPERQRACGILCLKGRNISTMGVSPSEETKTESIRPERPK